MNSLGRKVRRTWSGGRWVAILGLIAIVFHPSESRAQVMAAAMFAGQALTKGALSKVGGDAAGWVLGLLGLNPDPDKKLEKKIKAEFKALDQKIDALDTELASVETSVIAVYKQLLSNEAQQKITILDTQVAIIEPYWSTYRTILKDGTATNSQLSTFANDVTTNSVAPALDARDLILTANGFGQDGLIESYSKTISQALLPAVGDTTYYQDLHGVVAFYNKWRLRAITLLVESYHYQAAVAVAGASASTVCANPVTAAKLPCGQAAKYAKRFFDSSSASPTSGVIHQLRIAGVTMTTSSTVPIIGVKTVGGVPTPQPLLVSSGSQAVNIPLTRPSQELRFEWLPPVQVWPSGIGVTSGPGTPVPALPAVDGFGDWRFASHKDGETILSAVPQGKTAEEALSGALPWLSGKSAITVTLPSAHTSSSIWVREIHSGKAANCFMYYLDLTTTSPTSLSCGTITFDGSGYVALTEFGPIVNTCRYPPLCKVTEFLWDGPGQSPVPAVTDANNCPSGKSGTNPAGWLKPCGNGWVKRRYANELPSDDTLAALGEAVRVSEILRSQE